MGIPPAGTKVEILGILWSIHPLVSFILTAVSGKIVQRDVLNLVTSSIVESHMLGVLLEPTKRVDFLSKSSFKKFSNQIMSNTK